MQLAAMPDRVVALLFLLFFGALCVLALGLGYWDGFAPAAGFAPLWVGLAGVFLSIALLVSRPAETGEAADRAGLRRVASAALALVLFVALTPILGMIPAGFLLMLALLLLILRRPPLPSLVTSVVSIALVYAIFVAWLHVPLPKGVLGV